MINHKHSSSLIISSSNVLVNYDASRNIDVDLELKECRVAFLVDLALPVNKRGMHYRAIDLVCSYLDDLMSEGKLDEYGLPLSAMELNKFSTEFLLAVLTVISHVDVNRRAPRRRKS